MKKVLATLVLVLVASTVSAAEVKVGAWGRGFFVPYYTDGASDAKSMDAVSWGAGNPRIGMTISGTSDNVGFQVDFNGDGGAIGAGDQQKIWVKPIEMVTLSVGRAYDDTLRGNGCFGDFDWLRITGTGEDLTFARVTTHDGPFKPATIGAADEAMQGAIVALDPMKELHAYVAFRGITKSSTMENAMKNLQVGAGYTIGTLGQFRAQYIGVGKAKVDAVADDPETADVDETAPEEEEFNLSVINAAFKLTMVQNLYADLGIFFPLEKDDYGKDMTVAAYVKYTMGAIGIHALANVSLNQVYTLGDKEEEEMAMEFAAGFDYAIGNGLGFVSSFRYQNEGAAIDGDRKATKDGRIGVMVGVEKAFSNGKIGAGVEFSTTSMASMPEVNDGSTIASEEASIAIPVKVEYSF